jgi:predicted dehydrogenase
MDRNREPSERQGPGDPSRRGFLAGLVAGSALSALPGGLQAEEGAKPERRYRAAIIGHTGRGDYGHGLDLCFQKIPRVTVAAVADPVEEGRRAAVRRSGAARGYSDWREMLEKEKPELIAIGPRWVEGRLAMAGAAAAAGGHLFMEKPMAASLEEADAILAAAEKHGVKIAMAHHARVSPSVERLKSLLGEGLLGDLLEIRARGKEDRRAGGEDLMVLGTHCLYLMRFFAGEPLWCSARVTQEGREVTAADRRAASEPLGPVAGDCVHASYAFPGGVEGHFASQKSRAGGGGRFTIALYGSKGEAMVHIGMDPEIFVLEDPLWSPGKSGAAWKPLPGPPVAPDPSGLSGQDLANHRIILDLLRAIETGGQPRASGHEGRATLEMIFAVYASHLRGGRVSFPLADRRHPLGTLG